MRVEKKRRVLSGMRPTGQLHLGNLEGALVNWLRLQEEGNDCFFFVADYHALTTEYEHPGDLRARTRDMLADWLACGLDPERSTLFVQSQVPEHAELHLLLSMVTPVPWLERVPTYKEQQQELTQVDLSTYGFLGYPVLQAADILLYGAEGVPVGEDQLPHLELTREIARRFNHLYGQTFTEPQPILTAVPRLAGLDGRKMSKSYGNTIDLADGAPAVKKKVRSMLTDPARTHRNIPGHPEVCPVYSYHQVSTPEERIPQIARLCRSAGIGCVECKDEMAAGLERRLGPIREKREKLLRSPAGLDRILEDGRRRASDVARGTMRQVWERIGRGAAR